MAARTDSEFQDWLDAELAWRKQELRHYHTIAQSFKNVTGRNNSIIRAGIPLHYAHWEGFIKESSIAFLDFVHKKGLKNSELNDALLASSLQQTMKFGKQPSGRQVAFSMVDFFKHRLNSKCNVKGELAIDTRFNLNWEALEAILEVVSIDKSLFEGKAIFLDKILLKKRNSIAHGDCMVVSFDEYSVIHNEVMLLLDLFHTQIQNLVTTRAYLKIPT